MYQQLFELHADLLKALAHPRRLEIIHLLRDQELCVSDMHTMLDLPQANVSQHLMILKDAGVVCSRKDGKQIFYKICHSNFIKTSDLIREVLIENNKDSEIVNTLSFSMTDLVPLVHDPVCKMRLSPKTAGFSHKHAGEMYYFCASGCVKTFIERPKSYV